MAMVKMISNLPLDAPWWAYLLLALLWLSAYICRQVVAYKLGSKALDKVSPSKAPEVVDSVTGYQRERPGRRRLGR